MGLVLVVVTGKPWNSHPYFWAPMPCTPLEFLTAPSHPTPSLGLLYPEEREPLPGSEFLHPSVNDHRHNGSN